MPVSWQEFLTFDEKYLRGGKGGTKGGVKGGVKSAMPAKGMPVKGGGGEETAWPPVPPDPCAHSG